MSNILMQVESKKDLIQWNAWFNTPVQTNSNTSVIASTTHNAVSKQQKEQQRQKEEEGEEKDTLSQQVRLEQLKDECSNDKAQKRITRQSRLDSGITTHHLLSGEGEEVGDEGEGLDRRGSEMTDETLDSCYFQPVLSNSEYGISQILIAREAQQQQQQQHQESTISNSEQQDYHALFYSSFADYFSTTSFAANTTTPADSETTVVEPENNINNNM